MSDFTTAYRETRERFTELVISVPEEPLDGTVPACPEWTVRDLLAHVVGVAEDSVAGNLDGTGKPHWTAAQVARGKGRTVPELVTAWAEAAEQIEPALGAIPKAMAALMVADLATHEHDLRGALGARGARESLGVRLALDAYGRVRRRGGVPHGTLTLRSGEQTWVAGEGAPEATVSGPAFEMFRALAGRRTVEEIRSLDWDGDPGPFAAALPIFDPPGSSLRE